MPLINKIKTTPKYISTIAIFCKNVQKICSEIKKDSIIMHYNITFKFVRILKPS